ncbi:energy transducer TonB [Elizabethkingia meningoseptica]|uniref:energy transducer TonB n=1 Tax=Elizabethkingia meningoseptica TaxID=238 RepID=UPI00389200FF
MMKKILFFTLLGSLFFAQQKPLVVYDKYPPDVDFYEGGVKKFYNDIHEAIVKEKIEPCQNKNELYKVSFIVYPDNSIKFVKENDPLKIEQNKCAYELTRKTFRFLNGWNPPVVSGEKVAAVASAYIYPDDLFSNYRRGYDIMYYYTPPLFEGGSGNFWKKFEKNANVRGYDWDQKIRLVMHINIDEDGNMTGFKMNPGSRNENFDDMLIKSVRWIKEKWTPAKLHGINIETVYKFPITLTEE